MNDLPLLIGSIIVVAVAAFAIDAIVQASIRALNRYHTRRYIRHMNKHKRDDS